MAPKYCDLALPRLSFAAMRTGLLLGLLLPR
jgi:hypothetical protein